MARFNEHLYQNGPTNPFPGIKALERRLGRGIPHCLGSNEGLDMPHRALTARFGAEIAKLARSYGDAEAFGVRSRLASQYQLPMETLLVDAGADSLIALVLRATCTVGSRVVASAGTYPTFAYFAAGQGCCIGKVPYQEGPRYLAPDLESLAQSARKENARLIYLANPDNPSGHLHDDTAIRTLRDALPKDCTLLLDEAYHDFRQNAWKPQNNRPLPGVIRLRTFSKAQGLAGLRIGYAIAEAEDIAMLNKVRIHYGVSSIAQAAAETVLDESQEVERHIQAVVTRREHLSSWLESLGGDVLPSVTNFVALRLPKAEIAEQLHGELLKAGSLVHRPPHPALGHVLRISALEDALQPNHLAALERALRA